MCKCHSQSPVISCSQFWNLDWTRKKTESFPPPLHLSIMISSAYGHHDLLHLTSSQSPGTFARCSEVAAVSEVSTTSPPERWHTYQESWWNSWIGIVSTVLTIVYHKKTKSSERWIQKLARPCFFSFWRLCGNESSIEQYSRSQSRTGETWELQLKIVVEFHRFPINLYNDTKRLRCWKKEINKLEKLRRYTRVWKGSIMVQGQQP